MGEGGQGLRRQGRLRQSCCAGPLATQATDQAPGFDEAYRARSWFHLGLQEYDLAVDEDLSAVAAVLRSTSDS